MPTKLDLLVRYEAEIRRCAERLIRLSGLRLAPGDLVHEVFVLCEKAPRSDSYVVRWAVWRMRDIVRSQRRSKRLLLIEGVDLEELLDATATDEVIEKAAIERLRDVLPHLPDPQRHLIDLRYLQERTLNQTARILGVDVSTVTRRTRNALTALRRRLGNDNA